ncbi:MAG TPA: hypothetical protein VH594_19790 [Trebonia sp.]|jgi:hypothetical protein
MQGLRAIAVGMMMPTCVEKHPTELARCDVPRSRAILRNSPVSYAATLTRGDVAVVDANSLSTAQFVEPLLLKANKILAGEPS